MLIFHFVFFFHSDFRLWDLKCESNKLNICSRISCILRNRKEVTWGTSFGLAFAWQTLRFLHRIKTTCIKHIYMNEHLQLYRAGYCFWLLWHNQSSGHCNFDEKKEMNIQNTQSTTTTTTEMVTQLASNAYVIQKLMPK